MLTWESSCSDILLKSCSNLAQILFRFICFVNTCWLENLLAQISCSDLTQIYLLCQHLLTWESSCSDILLKSYSDLAQILLRSCLDLFALSILVDLRIFLLKYLVQILLKSYSDLTQILFKFICSINTCWLENLLAQILLRSCSNLV